MKTNRCTRVYRAVKASWNPTRLEKPVVDPSFTEMDALQRSAETFRYNILSGEFWLSKDGGFREYLRHYSRLALLIGVPAIVILPLIGLALTQIAAWAVALAVIAAHMFIIPAILLGLIIALGVALKLLKSLL